MAAIAEKRARAFAFEPLRCEIELRLQPPLDLDQRARAIALVGAAGGEKSGEPVLAANVLPQPIDANPRRTLAAGHAAQFRGEQGVQLLRRASGFAHDLIRL